MQTVGVKVEGLRELNRSLRRMSSELGVSVKALNLEAAQKVADTAEQLVPHGATNKLADSIRPAGQASSAVVRAGKASVPYAGPIHFGWPRHPGDMGKNGGKLRGGPIRPQPFLYEALDRRRHEVEEMYLRRIEVIKAQAGLL